MQSLMKYYLRMIGCFLLMAAAVQGLVAEEQPQSVAKIDFVKQIQPLLLSRCVNCHGPEKQEGRLRLDAPAIVTRGGVSGPAIKLGKPLQSLLYQRIVSADADERMPLEEPALGPAERELFRRWIEQGAHWPAGVGVQLNALAKHWSYQVPVNPELPKLSKSDWVRNRIDQFVLARMEEKQLTPSPETERRRLLRRVYLDLVGLPPTVEVVERFAASQDPRAYEKVVDQLMDSPRYGEKWARTWLDLARYADSNGYQADQYRNVWPYRDWVIRAINADMPFDQFTIEQLAGDLLPNPTVDQKIATGFQRLTTCNVEAGVDPEENRVNQVFDRVNTMGTVWLGTTVECMQCHNHKYDPFSQREYYQLFAFFNNTPLEVQGNGVSYNFTGPKMKLPFTGKQQAQRQQWQAEADQLQETIERLQQDHVAQLAAWEARMQDALQDMPSWQALVPLAFQSQGGASHEVRSDQSVLVSGKRPEKDVYTLTVRTRLEGISRFKLETLTDPALPGQGPGRFEKSRPNFVLNEFTVKARSIEAGSKDQALPLHGAQADFSQKNFAVAGAVDGDPTTAWAIAPQFHKPHEATFLLKSPVGDGRETELVFTLDQHYGGGRTIGRLRISAMTGDPTALSLPQPIVTILRRSPGKRTVKQKAALLAYYSEQDPQLQKWTQQRKKLLDQLKNQSQVTTLVMVEQAKPRMNQVFERGNFKERGESVVADTPRTLHPFSPDLPRNRLGFARWLMTEDNPLTARVTVNRWWASFFGRGLVSTMEDFGTQGERPTHPQLLDYLARELVSHGWSRKHLHKLIVMSATYRQAARAQEQSWQLDIDNRWLTRGPRFRLNAETIRDNALAISGLLTNKLGGPPVYPPQPAGIWRHVGRNEPKFVTSVGEDRFRRGIYVVWRRSAPYPSFTTFDAPDRATCIVSRSRTNTPLQALTLLNDPAYVEMMQSFARGMVRRTELRDDARRMDYAFQSAVARKPRPAERALLLQVLQEQRKRFSEDVASARKLVGKADQAAQDVVELAAWFHVANILLNLDETITKG
jgi:hypothetical protein